MSKIILAIALLLMLSSIALAKPETVDLGPYKVSFDLGRPCNIEVQEPKESERLSGEKVAAYQVFLSNNKGFAVIAINDFYDTKMDTSIEDMKKNMEDTYKGNGYPNFRTFEREIDNHPGVVGFAQMPGKSTMYNVNYSPDSEGVFGSVLCTIASTYPEDEGTLDLIKTIHIELPANKMEGL